MWTYDKSIGRIVKNQTWSFTHGNLINDSCSLNLHGNQEDDRNSRLRFSPVLMEVAVWWLDRNRGDRVGIRSPHFWLHRLLSNHEQEQRMTDPICHWADQIGLGEAKETYSLILRPELWFVGLQRRPVTGENIGCWE